MPLSRQEVQSMICRKIGLRKREDDPDFGKYHFSKDELVKLGIYLRIPEIIEDHNREKAFRRWRKREAARKATNQQNS